MRPTNVFLIMELSNSRKFPKNPLPEYKIDKSEKSDEIY